MKTYPLLPTVFIFLLAFLSPLSAQQDLSAEDRANLASLHWISGSTPIPIPDANCTLTLTKNFKFLNADDTHTVLEKLWHNPPNSNDLGMIFPIDGGPENSWGVTISYLDNGHTDDSDAKTIDYDKLLEQMKQKTRENNEVRVSKGYDRLDLVGWAQPPRYDSESHKLFWAKNLSSDKNGPFLNYDFRILGRSGTLILRAIARPDQLDEINSKSLEIISMAEFDSGNRYSDFNSWTDRAAEGGLAALVVGGGYTAVKTGLFAGALAFMGKLLFAGGKFIALAVVAVIGAFRNFFSNMFGRKDIRLPNNNNPDVR